MTALKGIETGPTHTHGNGSSRGSNPVTALKGIETKAHEQAHHKEIGSNPVTALKGIETGRIE